MNRNIWNFIIIISIFGIFTIIFITSLGMLITPVLLIHEPIFLFYNQENFPLNFIEPFLLSLISPFIGLIIGIFLSFLLFKITEIFNFIRFRKYRKNNLNKYPFESLEIEDKSNFIWKTVKKSIIATIFSFSISFQILKIPNIIDFLINTSLIEGSTIKLIYGYYAILPIIFIITTSIYSSIWMMESTNIFLTYEQDNEIINRHRVSDYFNNLLKNYTTISTFLVLFLTVFDFGNDIVNLGIEINIFVPFIFILFVLGVLPFFFYAVIAIIYVFNPLKKIKNQKY